MEENEIRERLRELHLRVEVSVVRSVIQTAMRKERGEKVSWYSLYTGDQYICGKGTVDKIREIRKAGELQFLEDELRVELFDQPEAGATEDPNQKNRSATSTRLRLSVFWTHHVEAMQKVVEELRSCLYDPHLTSRIYLDDLPPLLFRNHDWSLIPRDWVLATTPYLEKDAKDFWSDALPYFLQHSKEFKERHDQLHQMAKELDRDLNEAVEGLGVKMPRLLEEWKNFRSKQDWVAVDGRTPGTPSPEWIDEPPSYPDNFASYAKKRLIKGPMPDLYKRLFDMVKILDQLNQGLTESEVERGLAGTTCDMCKDVT